MSNEDLSQKLTTGRKASYHERLVSALRHHLHISETQESDDELLKNTKGTLIRELVEFEIAKADFARAVAPVIDKVAKDIRKAVSKIRLKL